MQGFGLEKMVFVFELQPPHENSFLANNSYMYSIKLKHTVCASSNSPQQASEHYTRLEFLRKFMYGQFK